MLRLILSRLLGTIPLLLALSVLAFALIHLIPGSAALRILGEGASPESIAQVERQLGLDQPLAAQYGRWVGGVVQGNLGQSLVQRRPVSQMIAERLPATLSLVTMAFAVALVVGLGSGIVAGIRPGSATDRSATVLASVGLAVPEFWLAVLLSLVFAVQLRWFPAVGYTPFSVSPAKWLQGLVLPAIALGLPSAAIIARQMRGSLVRVLQLEYIRAARASGLSPRSIVGRHALKNALIPVLTVIGFQIPVILGGAFVVEQVYAIPGLGSLTVRAILDRDLPLVQAIILLTGTLIILTNLVVDIGYAWLNPKVRLG
jgi:peptide/nickel transport system permease protein